MEELFLELENAFADYRRAVDESMKRSRPTDGLLGFGRSLKDDACHDILDRQIDLSVGKLCRSGPDEATAERAVRMLLFREDLAQWPLAAQWMLIAIQRHSLPLIPFLSPGVAAALYKAYSAQYRPWERLPAQNEILKALKEGGKDRR